MKQTVLALAIFAAMGTVHAQTTPPCPAGTLNCSNQSMGDHTTNADNNQSQSSQVGNSTSSNQSGNSMTNGSNDLQQSGNSNSVQSGNNTTATGGAGGSATGNLSNNNNQSSVGNTSSNSGGNTLNNGSNSGGNVLGNSGGNSSNSNMGNGNGSNNTTTANGGAGGAGGAGGSATGGNATGGNATTGNNTNNNGNANANKNNTSSSAKGGNASQGQSSANANKNSATTGNNKNSASTDSSGNSSTRVDASNNSKYEAKTIFIPPIIPPTPASSLAVGNIVKETTACGPLVKIIETKVEGTFHGLFFDSKVDQGKHQEMTEARDEQGNIVSYREELLADGTGYRLFGHQVTQYTAIIGVSGARNIALGGGGNEGAWGQGGMGTSSANQRLVTTLQVRGCEIGTFHYKQTQPYELFMSKRIRN